MSEQRAIVTLLLKYSESHLNPTNEAIHCLCVPLIVFRSALIVPSPVPLPSPPNTMLILLFFRIVAVNVNE